MINICAWNVRGLNKANKQIEVANLLSTNNIILIGLLKIKIKMKALEALYLQVFPSRCTTSNLTWHDGAKLSLDGRMRMFILIEYIVIVNSFMLWVFLRLGKNFTIPMSKDPRNVMNERSFS